MLTRHSSRISSLIHRSLPHLSLARPLSVISGSSVRSPPVSHHVDNLKDLDLERKAHPPSSQPSVQSASPSSWSINASEVSKFSHLSSLWWRLDGPFGQLHRMQEARVPFIRDAFLRHRASNSFSTRDSLSQLKPFKDYSILDVGCGGGLLSESLARMGGNVKGIDASESNIRIAQQHKGNDSDLSTLQYEHMTAESLLERGELFDLVCSVEVVEHVENPRKFVETLCNLVKPGGSLVLSTINRTQLSYFMAIFMAERVLGFAPPGTHEWNKFLTPQELKAFVEESAFIAPENARINEGEAAGEKSPSRPSLGFQVDCLNGMVYNPLGNSWSLSEKNLEVNFILSAKRPF